MLLLLLQQTSDSAYHIGLPGLYSIQHGAVRAERNPKLCYVNTILWKNITATGSNFFLNNQLPNECSLIENCNSCTNNNCWTKDKCQKFAVYHPECDEQCLGACTGPGPAQCNVCRTLRNGSICVDRCPPERLVFLDTMRCSNPAKCVNDKVIYENSCLLECPAGFMNSSGICIKCPKQKCPNVCRGAIITSISDAQHFKGCTIVNGSLQIRLSEAIDITQDLLHNLSEIEEIIGILKVYRSFSLKSLHFFTNLKVIHGNEELDSNKYSLMVFENQNLQNLFNVTSLRIEKGSILFNNNPYLCLSEIEKFQQYTNLTKLSLKDSFPSWNGYKANCNFVKIKTFAGNVFTTNATIYWENYKNVSSNGYMIYYIKAPEKNVRIYYGMDTCLENSWNGTQFKEKTQSQYLKYTLTDLNAFTQYAFYVRSYDLESPVLNFHQEVQSNLEYFKTLTDQPSGVERIRTVSKNSSSITITWFPPSTPNGILSHYKLYVFHHPDENDFLDPRNYCKEPMEDIETNPELEMIQSAPAQQSCFCPDDEPLLSIDQDESDICIEGAETHHSCSQMKYSSNRVRRALAPHVRVKEFPDVIVDGYYEVTTINFSAELTQYTVNHLRYYGLYTLQLAACNINEKNYEVCSPIEHFTDRAGKYIRADDILDFRVETRNNEVFLKWSEPEKPNGVIITYFIEYGKYEWEKAPFMTKCVTRLHHAMNNYTHTLLLEDGTYKTRVKAQSLAGDGRYTNMVEFNVTKIEIQFPNTGIVLLYCAPGIALMAVLIYCLNKHNCFCTPYAKSSCFKKKQSTCSKMRNDSWNDSHGEEQDMRRQILIDEITNQLFDDTAPNLGLIKRDFNVRYFHSRPDIDDTVQIKPNTFLTSASIEAHACANEYQ
ncbi:insulin-like receptor [Ctenocephalides felis]|uniref:insulin-like receptor n=1 Tax=Ctenocephalides felis TaxID=7515 RepID=UPI000E6E3C42|nr:insulin-like receptor [Ctenocephalides felis]